MLLKFIVLIFFLVSPTLQNFESKQISNCIHSRWDAIDTGFCANMEYQIKFKNSDGTFSETELKTTSNLHSFCFEDNVLASSYVATQVTARFVDATRNIDKVSVTEIEIVKQNLTLSENKRVEEGDLFSIYKKIFRAL